MKNNDKNFDWSFFIKDLDSLPDFSRSWEDDFLKNTSLFLPEGKEKKILEVGCSNGRWLRWFNKKHGYLAYGIDNNKAGFKKDEAINFKEGDGKKIFFPDGFFDIVFSLGLVEHFKKEEKAQLLLKKTGPFLTRQLQRCYVGSLLAFWTLLDFQLNLLAFIKAFEAVSLNLAMMNKNITA